MHGPNHSPGTNNSSFITLGIVKAATGGSAGGDSGDGVPVPVDGQLVPVLGGGVVNDGGGDKDPQFFLNVVAIDVFVGFSALASIHYHQ